MKKLLFFLLLLMSIQCQSQNSFWFSDNDIWFYRWSEWYYHGYKKIWVSGEEEIEGKLCKKIEDEIVFVSSLDNYTDTVVTTTNPNYYYESNDSVWVIFDSQFSLIYNFNMAPGDSLRIDKEAGTAPCSAAFFVLDSITTPADLGGRRVQYGHLTGGETWWLFFVERMVIIEGIGIVRSKYTDSAEEDDFGYLNVMEHFECATDIPTHYFCSFANGNWEYKPNDIDCRYLRPPLTSAQEVVSNPIRIFPNPAIENTVFFEIPQGSDLKKISLYSATGQYIQDIPLNAHSFHADSPGLYFLICQYPKTTNNLSVIIR